MDCAGEDARDAAEETMAVGAATEAEINLGWRWRWNWRNWGKMIEQLCS